MEHLMDYGSSDDDDDSNKHTTTTTTTATTTTTSNEKGDDEKNAVATAVSVSSTSREMTAPTTKQRTPSALLHHHDHHHHENKKGKRILSLESVLPAHILRQLTRSQVRGDDDNDDDDDDDDGTRSHDHRGKSAPSSSTKGSGDDGIDSFLSDLHKSAPAATKALLVSPSEGSSSNATTTTGNKGSKLGAAFLSTTTVTTTTKTKSHPNDTNVVVRDIHGESSIPPVEQEYEQKPEEESKDTMKPPATTTTRTVKPSLRSVPRPSRVVPVASIGSVTTTSLNDGTATAAPSREMEGDSPSHGTMGAPSNPKRRRQEMERLLRRGQWDAALNNNNNNNNNYPSSAASIVEMEQPRPFQPTDGATQDVDTTGLVRMAATPMYDPSQGQAVVGKNVTTAGRGKNQINHLLASAANLELARARGMAAKPGQRSHRANAKRKYGW